MVLASLQSLIGTDPCCDSVGMVFDAREAGGARLDARTESATYNASRYGIFPTFTPDGKGFVYASRQSGNYDLYLQRIGGKNATSITPNTPSDESHPAFSPNGERIAFRSNRPGWGLCDGTYWRERSARYGRLLSPVMVSGWQGDCVQHFRHQCAAKQKQQAERFVDRRCRDRRKTHAL